MNARESMGRELGATAESEVRRTLKGPYLPLQRLPPIMGYPLAAWRTAVPAARGVVYTVVHEKRQHDRVVIMLLEGTAELVRYVPDGGDPVPEPYGRHLGSSVVLEALYA